MSQSFISYLKAEGFITQDEAAVCKGCGECMSDLGEKTCKKLADAGYMTEKEMDDALFFYKMSAYVEDNTVNLEPEHMDDNFFTDYVGIVIKGFHDFVKVKAIGNEVELYSSIQEEFIIYQPLIGQSENTFITGIAGGHDELMKVAARLHKEMVAGLDVPEFKNTKEELIDFYFELINNINSTCTYKFNVNFDLELPLCQENTILRAPRIYTVKFSFLDDLDITIFLICGDSISFEREGE